MKSEKYMEHLSLLIKPASSLCNMRCKYCFYHDIAENRENRSFGIMNSVTAENLIKKAIDFAEKSVSFIFQGGEPTLAGLDFFEIFTQTVKRLNTKGLKVNYAIQTNGINIDEYFAELFSKNNFLVGLSLDGIRDINDFLRIDSNENGTHKKIISTARLFDKYKIEYNILTVISAYTAKHIQKIYNYYKKCGFRYLQFIPCLDSLESEPFPSNFSLTPQLYEAFLKNLFRLWYNDLLSDNYISIRYFENLVGLARGERPEQCGLVGHCSGQFVIEGDGTTFPCDFYCLDWWKTGNINDLTFEEISKSDNMIRFIQTSLSKHDNCNTCKVYYLCRGGCRRERFINPDETLGENIYCDALYNFLIQAEPYLKNIAFRFR